MYQGFLFLPTNFGFFCFSAPKRCIYFYLYLNKRRHQRNKSGKETLEPTSSMTLLVPLAFLWNSVGVKHTLRWSFWECTISWSFEESSLSMTGMREGWGISRVYNPFFLAGISGVTNEHLYWLKESIRRGQDPHRIESTAILIYCMPSTPRLLDQTFLMVQIWKTTLRLGRNWLMWEKGSTDLRKS